jgi:malate dehydrogenase (oxaloacetate-decarboxylating)(NADP+)
MHMKIAAAEALAALAREEVPDEVDRAYAGRRLRFGPDYIIPAPFDPRLIVAVPKAVAEAAMTTGVARRPIEDLRAYEHELAARLDPTAGSLDRIFTRVREAPKRVVFAEGEEEATIRAAFAFHAAGYGTPVLVGREELIHETMGELGLKGDFLEIHNARLSDRRARYTDYLYGRLQRQGKILRDCQRMVNQNRNVFAACMVAVGDADAMVTGLTRSFGVAFDDIRRAIDPQPGHRAFGMSIYVTGGRSLFMADTSVHELPTPEELADIAVQSAAQARRLGHVPRVALLSFSNFGNPMREKAKRVRDAVKVLDSMQVDFEYDGEMQANVALDYELMRRLYPFCRLKGPANVLVMPALHSANITAKLMQSLTIGTVIGPIMLGLSKSAQIVPLGASVNDLVTAAAIAAHDAGVARS